VNSRLILLFSIAGAIAQIGTPYASIHIVFLFYNIYTPVGSIIIFFFFSKSFFLKRGRKIFYFSAIAGFVMALYFLLFVGIKYRFLSEWVCFNNIIYTTWILSLLLDIYEDDSAYLNQKMPLFWYLLGMFFFTSCTILIFSFWDYIMIQRIAKNKYISLIFGVYGLFNIFMYTAFSIGLLLDASDNLKMNKKN